MLISKIASSYFRCDPIAFSGFGRLCKIANSHFSCDPIAFSGFGRLCKDSKFSLSLRSYSVFLLWEALQRLQILTFAEIL